MFIIDKETLDLLQSEVDWAKKHNRPYFISGRSLSVLHFGAEDIRDEYKQFIQSMTEKYKTDPKIIEAIISNKIYRSK